MRPEALLTALALAASPAAAEVSVRVAGGTVELTASAAPLGEVLDRLARQTGMKVVYEGPAPRQLVTVTLRGRSPAETVLALLEGLGLNFALMGDPGGAGVQTLLVAGTASTSPATATAASTRQPAAPRPVRRPFGPPPGASPEAVDPAFEEPEEDLGMEDPAFMGLPPGAEEVMPPEVPGVVDPSAANPAGLPPGVPAQGTAPVPTPPSFVSPFSASPFTPQPQPFPPLPPGAPPAPTAPAGEEGAPETPPPD